MQSSSVPHVGLQSLGLMGRGSSPDESEKRVRVCLGRRDLQLSCPRGEVVLQDRIPPANGGRPGMTPFPGLQMPKDSLGATRR